MSENKLNYKPLKFYDLDLISNVVLNQIEENKLCEFTYNDEFDIYNILEKVLESFLIKFNRVLLLTSNIEELYKHNKIINSLKENIYEVSKENNIEEKLINLISNLPYNTGKTLLSKVEVLNRKIDKDIQLLNNITDFFYNKDEEGLNLVDKYYITEKEINNNEKKYYYYKIFRIKKPFENLSYAHIKAIKDEIEKRNIIPIYIRYRRYLDNSRFTILKNNITNSLLYETINKLAQLNTMNTVKFNCSNLKYKKDFIENFIINQNMNLTEVSELANIINTKYNGHLLEKRTDKSFFSIFKKKKMEYINLNIEKYNYIKQDILREFNKLYNNINLELTKWSFLSNVLVEEEYLKLKLMIIKGEDIKEKLMFYDKVLQLSKNSESIKSNIESLESTMKEVLDYCYDSIEYKNDLEDIIKNIDKIKLYYDIENIEARNTNIVDEYQKFDLIKERIHNNIRNRNLLIKDGIKLLWDNLIRETYKISSLNIDKIDYSNRENFKSITPIVLSSNNKIFDDENFSNIDSFDKIIIFNKIENVNLERIKENISEDKIITFRYTNKEIIELKEEKSNINLNAIEDISIKRNFINHNILDDIIAYIGNNGYIVNKNINTKEDIYKLIITNLNKTKEIGIIIDTETFDYKENYYIKELYLNDIKENFFIYRIWSRDIWINKNKVLKRLLEYVKQVL